MILNINLQRVCAMPSGSFSKMAADLSVEKAVILIQAHVRSFLVRRKLLEIRKEFEEVLRELETDSKVVCWKTEGLGLPLIISDPDKLSGANEKTNLSDRESGHDKLPKQDVLLKEGLIIGNGELLSNTTKVGYTCNADTTRHSHSREDINLVGVHRGQLDEDFPLLKRTFDSERYDDELPQNQGGFVQIGTDSLLREEQNNERTLLGEDGSERLSNSGVNAEVIPSVSKGDKCPYKAYKVPEFPCAASSPSSTLKRTSSEKQGIKEKAGHAVVPANMPGRLHLRDQALLSESWMTDRSFDTVLSDESTTDLPSDPVKLLDVRDHIAMELLWTEQAIQSRKHYLDLREGLAEVNQDGTELLKCQPL